MDNNQEQIGFTYAYSAKDQAELKRIRAKYAVSAETEDKMARLRRLDASVTSTAQAVALAFGVLGTLILGFGMSLVLSDLAEILGRYRDMSMVIGVATGVVGGVIASMAYPVYNAIVKVKRKRLAPEILRLTDELMK